MKTLILWFMLANLFLSCSSTGTANDIPTPSKTNFKGEPLPQLNLYPSYKVTFSFEKDNDTTLKDSDVKIIDAISEYLRVNKDFNVYMKCYMHENEIKDVHKKRRDFIKDRMVEAGISERRVMAAMQTPAIPQDESDIFTEEELIKARRVELQIIK